MPKAKNLKYFRKKAGLTQQAFADEIGVSKATVISWEAKKTAIPAPITKRIAEYFGVEYTDFCDTDLEWREHGFSPTEEEVRTFMRYKDLSAETKAAVLGAINAAYEGKAKGG